MEVVIKLCPGCDQLLVDDSGVCPGCGMTLESGQAVALAPAPGAPTIARPASTDVPCQRCGAMVPKTLVRCPSCQSLMQSDRSFRPDQGRPQVRTAQMADADDFDDMVSDVQLIEDPALMAELDARASYSAPKESADGDDFEVGGGASVVDFDNSVSYLSAPAYQGDPDAGLVDIDENERRDEREAALAAEEAGPSTYDLSDPAYGEGTTGELPPDDSAAGYYQDGAQPVQEGYEQEVYDQSGYDQGGYAEEPPVQEQDAAEAPPAVHDPLLAAALEEQAESGKSRVRGKKTRRDLKLAADAFLVYCPNGHRIVVREQYRGRVGRCPNCRAPFFVPTESIVEEAGVAEAAMPTGDVVGAYDRWVIGARMHAINPTKLKLKDSSVVGTHDVVDLGFMLDQALLAIVFPGNTAFRGMVEAKKTTANRDELRQHLRGGGSLDQMPVKFVKLAPENFGELRLVQPAIPGDESIFAGVPVFGPGMIVFRLPAAETQPTERQYLSLTLSQYRTLAEVAAERFGVSELAPSGLVPLADEFQPLTCHYSDVAMQTLKNVELYRVDSSFKLQLLGWQCEGCGLIVSEDSRKKEKIGGKAETSVPKAKCPKCKKKFGDNRLYGFASTSS
jgi:hypothetical protein